jgi:adenylate kinase family enzyme
MQRVLVIGCCGSGKSTLSGALAARLGVPHVELDAFHHGPGWVPRPTFAEDVDRATREPAWVVDGNYADVRELLWSRADTVVWLDLPRWLVEVQVVRRSIRRWLLREVLWNGNIEKGPSEWIDPEHPIRWAWHKHGDYRTRYSQRFAAAKWEHLTTVRLRSRREVSAFVTSVGRTTPD